MERAKKKHEAEVKERWGGTKAYTQSKQRAADRSSQENDRLQQQMNAFFARAAALRGQSPAGKAAQELVQEWREFLAANYYDCTMEILSGLGQMYTADERFAATLDRNGEGTAAFFNEAIAVYCTEQKGGG